MKTYIKPQGLPPSTERYCTRATHYPQTGQHIANAPGHRWVEIPCPAGVRFTFDEVEPNGHVIEQGLQQDGFIPV